MTLVGVETYRGQIVNEVLDKVQFTMAQLDLMVISPFPESMMWISMFDKWCNSHVGAITFPMVKLLIPHTK